MSEARTSPAVAGLGSLGLIALGTFAAAAIGGAASAGAAGFYATLQKPAWAPPPQVFGPVWTVLYALIAVAAWLVVRERGWSGAWIALSLYAAQLVVNALWTWLFFAWRLGAASFVDIIVLVALVAGTIVAFWRIRPLAGALMLPYLAWITFASFLTWSVWRGNPGVL